MNLDIKRIFTSFGPQIRILLPFAIVGFIGLVAVAIGWLYWGDYADETNPPVGVYEAPVEQKLDDMMRGEGPPLVFAHRGDHLFFGQNSLEAFQRALDRGNDGIELDVINTADDVPVIAHNFDLRHDDRHVFVPDASVDEVRALADALPEEQGARFRTLDTVLERFGAEILMVVELKAEDDDDYGVVEPTCRALQKHGADKTVILSSLKYHVIDTVLATEACDGIALMYEWSKTGDAPPDDYGLPLIGLRHDLLAGRKDQLPESVRVISVYTPNWAFQIERAMDQGALLIQTDYPSRAMRLRGELFDW